MNIVIKAIETMKAGKAFYFQMRSKIGCQIKIFES